MHKLLRCSKYLLLAAIVLLVIGFAVMGLWNYLMPVLFGWHTIGFFQAIGLFALSKILFGFGGGPARHIGRRRLIERWEQMSPEERERFREGLRGCGPFGPSQPPKA